MIRKIRWLSRALTWEANPRHVMELMKELRFEEAKGCATPADDRIMLR